MTDFAERYPDLVIGLFLGFAFWGVVRFLGWVLTAVIWLLTGDLRVCGW